MRRAARSDRGQATVDYVALLGLVALLLAVGGAAVTVSGVGDRLMYALRQGLCAVGGVLCPPPPEPCVVRRGSNTSSGTSVGLCHFDPLSDSVVSSTSSSSDSALCLFSVVSSL